MKLGVKRGTVNIVAYSSGWLVAFEKEKRIYLGNIRIIDWNIPEAKQNSSKRY